MVQDRTNSGKESPLSDGMLKEPADFSLVLGGPLFQAFRRMHLTDDALSMLVRRMVVISMFAWLPLLIISILEGHMLGSSVVMPFLLDIEVHVKFLIVVPMLVAAELMIHQRMRHVIRQFLGRDLIPENAMKSFNSAVSSSFRLRNSVLAEVLLIGIVYVVGVTVLWRHFMALDTSSWYAISAVGGSDLSFAGMWYAYVSLPVFQFLLLRWYFRWFIWVYFLWKVSRIDLNLVPTHPDKLGGLGFVSGAAHAFSVLAAAHGTLLAGNLTNRIFYSGSALPDFKGEIILVVCFLLCMVFGPLMVFSAQLARVKRTGKLEYDMLAQRYVREFDSKWLRGGAPAGEQLVGSGDIQSLADMGNSLEVVRSMRVFPITKDSFLQVVGATLVPIAPLALTMMPLEELLKKLFGVLF